MKSYHDFVSLIKFILVKTKVGFCQLVAHCRTDNIFTCRLPQSQTAADGAAAPRWTKMMHWNSEEKNNHKFSYN